LVSSLKLNLHVSKLILIYLAFGGIWCSQKTEREVGSSVLKKTHVKIDTVVAYKKISKKNTLYEEKLDSLEIIDFLKRHPEVGLLKNDLISFYQQRDFHYAWLQQNLVAEHTYALYNKVLQLIDNGITYNAPYIDQFKSIMENQAAMGIRDQAAKELIISCQYLYFINNINTKLADKDIESLSWFIIKKRINYESFYKSLLVDSLKKNKDELYPQYYLLLEALKTYATAKNSGKWNLIHTNKKIFKPLDTAFEISQIRKNLYLLGDLTMDSGDSIYDNKMVTGVNSFQERHGLKKQEVIELQFIKLMNIPLQGRIEQILINMERCKWLPNETNQDYIIVNIPQFTLQAFTGDSLIFKCKVVVGKETNRTMIFQGDIKHIVFSPYWNVPESILKKEILPAIRKDSNYLIENNMEWYNGNVRQRPGETNALGRVKFIFPNTFNIYLHDTPSKILFEFEKRTFSHGCIRISEPLKLAEFLLRKDSTWDEEKILDAMLTEREKTVRLKEGVPVYIIYLTSFVDELGKLNFREDVYKRDNALKQILFSKKTLIGD
jgi:murein L,D-transpeptidase YcbB/YkuD